MAFNLGHEAGAEAATCGELLAEAEALQLRSTTSGKIRRAVALEELEMAVSVEPIEYEEDFGCGLFRALEAIEGQRPTPSLTKGTVR